MNKCKIEEERLIQYAYGELNRLSSIRLVMHIRKCPACRQLVAEHKALRRSFGVFPSLSCPELPLNNAGSRQKVRFRYWRYAFAAAIIALFAIGITKIEQRPAENRFSKAEVRQAKEDAQTALTVLSKVMDETGKELGKDILPRQVTEPLRKSMSTLKPLLYGGSS